ncbi:MAG TPA: TetR/AcrR family transcriptional regulator [Burkholderiaceae bacterium]|nr:TetR/AcrR family transcriptional regulator [Burkholderiaceae bacterium]
MNRSSRARRTEGSPPMPPDGPSADPIRRRLPRGASSLPQELIVEIQRQRLLEAMTLEVAERGYPATSVADIISRAGVSRKTFYELFSDKEACYLTGFAEIALRHVSAVRAAVRGESEVRNQLMVALRAYLSLFDENPIAARAFFAEALGARAVSPEMATQWLDYTERFEALLRRWAERVRELSPRPMEPISAITVTMAFGGVNTFLITKIRVGNAHPLVDHLPALHEFVVNALNLSAAVSARPKG